MNKRNIKQFIKKYWGWFAFVLWIFLFPTSIVLCFVEVFSLWIRITIGAFITLYTIAGIIMIFNAAIKDDKKQQVERDKKFQELKIKYKYHIDLINKKVKETLTKFKEELVDVDIDISLEYLISFSKNVDWICDNRITGKPDSFIIASCLMYGLLSNPVIKLNNSEQYDFELRAIEKNVNIDIALSCVLEIISEPITYYEENNNWVEEKHPKVNIVIPKGLIKNNELYQRIQTTILRDELANNRTSIMQFSNLLHLIYLNSLNSQ